LRVTQNGGRQAFESADGLFIYYVKPSRSGGVWRMPTQGGEEEKVLDEGSVGEWALTNAGIYVLDPSANAIRCFSFTTKTKETVVTIPEDARIFLDSFAVSPDGRQFLYVQEDQVEADLVLVENFR